MGQMASFYTLAIYNSTHQQSKNIELNDHSLNKISIEIQRVNQLTLLLSLDIAYYFCIIPPLPRIEHWKVDIYSSVLN